MKMLMILSIMLSLFTSNAQQTPQQKSIDSAQWAELRWIVYQLSFLDTAGFRKEDKRMDSVIKVFNNNLPWAFVINPFAGSISWNPPTNNPIISRSSDLYSARSDTGKYLNQGTWVLDAVPGNTFTWDNIIRIDSAIVFPEFDMPNSYCLTYVKERDRYVASYYFTFEDELAFLVDEQGEDHRHVDITMHMKEATFFHHKSDAVNCIKRHWKQIQQSRAPSSADHAHTRTMRH